MPNIGQKAAPYAVPDGLPLTAEAGVLPDEHGKTVRVAVEALGTDLDDAYSRDPTGFYANLRADALRSALCRLIGGLGENNALHLLDWMSTRAVEKEGSLIAAVNPPLEMLAFVQAGRRRTIFNRLMSPDRLAQLVSACSPDQPVGAG